MSVKCFIVSRSGVDGGYADDSFRGSFWGRVFIPGTFLKLWGWRPRRGLELFGLLLRSFLEIVAIRQIRQIRKPDPLLRPFQLPAAEMRAAIDVQDVTSDRRGVGQVHDRIRDVLDR